MTRDTAERARELYYNLKPECQPHSDGCKGCADNLADIEKLLTQIQAEARERLATWMVERSFSTGHGDTFEDLLKELDWQVKEMRGARLEEAKSIKSNYEEMNGAPFEKWLDKRIAALAQALQPEEREGADVRTDVSIKE